MEMKQGNEQGLLKFSDGALIVMFWLMILGLAALGIMLVLGLLDLAGVTALNLPATGNLVWSAMGLQLELPSAAMDSAFFTVSSLMGLALVAFGLLIVMRIRRILRRVREGEAFHPAQAGDVAAIGWLILISEAVQTGAQWYVSVRMAEALQLAAGAGVQVEVQLSLRPEVIFLGLMMLLLARIFIRGAELEEEQRYTV